MCTAASLLGMESGRNMMLITPHYLVPGIRMGGAKTLARAGSNLPLICPDVLYIVKVTSVCLFVCVCVCV